MRTDRQFLIAIPLSYLVSGVALALAPERPMDGGPIAVAHLFVLSFLCFGWCRAHASANGVQPPYAAPFLMALFAPLGLPYYAVRTWGWKRGTFLCFKGVGLVLLSGLLAGLGVFAVGLVRA